MIFDTMHWHSHSCGWNHQSKRTLLYPRKSGIVIFWHHFWHMGMDRLDCSHKKWMPKVLPNMESHGIPWCSGEDIFRTFWSLPNLRSPFYTHESGKRTKPGRIKRAPCDSQQRLGGSPGWVKCGDWKAARFSFLSSYVSVCRFNYLLYLLLLYVVFIIIVIIFFL